MALKRITTTTGKVGSDSIVTLPRIALRHPSVRASPLALSNLKIPMNFGWHSTGQGNDQASTIVKDMNSFKLNQSAGI
jgi:hypothetical protein